TGAMVVSYGIAVPTFGLIVIALLVLGLDTGLALLTGAALYLGLAPFIFRYSRVIWLDRKSTRLNSSHVSISYAVFCLKKQKARGGARRTERCRAGARSRCSPR